MKKENYIFYKQFYVFSLPFGLLESELAFYRDSGGEGKDEIFDKTVLGVPNLPLDSLRYELSRSLKKKKK